MFTKHMVSKSNSLYQLAKEGMEFNGAYREPWITWKKDWLYTGRSVLRALAKELGFHEYKVWTNKAGVAVPGETLMMGIWADDRMQHDWKGIYLDTADPSMYGHFVNPGQEPPSFMWRKIKHMKDYTGGHNRWMSYAMFQDPNNLVLTLKGMTERPWL